MSEKNITSLNQLKNWFKTGLKPTQAQFWAWLDSFWHKDEEIPQEKITGLAESLENKADNSAVEVKANADATGLSEEQKQAWKEALEVGEIPTNIALIDEVSDDGNKQGNVYTKTKSNELLGEKLDKPTQTATTTEAPFVVGINEENESYKLPAGDLGKNIGNTDLIIPRGTVRTLDVTGARFGIQGLENKKQDASFNRRIKADERGTLAYTDEAEITVNIPEQFSGTSSIANTTITVNHIFPNSIPEKPSFAKEIQNIMAKYSTYDFTPILGSDYTLWTKDNLATDINTIRPDGQVTLKGVASWNSVSGQVVLKGKANIILPSNKDWILKINAQKMQVRRVRNLIFGVCRTAEDTVQYGGAISGYDFHGHVHEFDILNTGPAIKTNKSSSAIYLLIKKSGVITTLIYCGDSCVFSAQSANIELGNFSPAFNIIACDITQNLNMSLKMSYKILE